MTPKITIKVNDNFIRNEGNAGKFYLDDAPSFSYELSPNTLNSDYYFSSGDTKLGKEVPSEVGIYKYNISVFGNDSYIDKDFYISFELRSPKETPTITLSVNGNIIDEGVSDLGTYYLDNPPIFIYQVNEQGLESDYYYLLGEEKLDEFPISTGTYSYVIEIKGNEDYKDAIYTYTFSLKEKDYIIFDAAPEIRVVTDNANNDFATTPTKSTKSQITYQVGHLSTTGCLEKYQLEDVPMQIKARGNYTLNYQKKPFRIKFDSKTNLFGLNKGNKFKNWVLLADVKDSSMMRNMLSFYLGKRLLGENGLYSSDFTPVHLYLNNEYWGMYLLCEQQEVKKNRVGVSEVEDDYLDTDIGYFMEYDGYYNEEGPDGDPTFTINYLNHAQIKNINGQNSNVIQDGYTIKSDIYSEQQQQFIKDRLEATYEVLYHAVMNNTSYDIDENNNLVVNTTLNSEEIVNKYVNVSSLVDTYIINDIACDPDIAWSSFYLSLDMSAKGDKKLRFEAPWDFDSAYGIRSIASNITGSYVGTRDNPWLKILSSTDFFKEKLETRWKYLIKENGIISDAFNMLNDFTSRYVNDYSLNYTRWPNTIGYNPEVASEVVSIANTFRTQNDAYLYLCDWVSNRINDLTSIYIDESKEFLIEVDKYVAANKKIRYEAEDATSNKTITIKNSVETSNGSYIGNLNGNAGIALSFDVTGNDEDALIMFNVAVLENDAYNTDYFDIYLNDTKLNLVKTKVKGSGSEFNWHNWRDVPAIITKLNKGNNTIRFVTRSSSSSFDYFDIYSL